MFWVGDSLKPEVREALMRFAKAFAAYVDLDDRAITDVILLGVLVDLELVDPVLVDPVLVDPGLVDPVLVDLSL